MFENRILKWVLTPGENTLPDDYGHTVLCSAVDPQGNLVVYTKSHSAGMAPAIKLSVVMTGETTSEQHPCYVGTELVEDHVMVHVFANKMSSW